MRWSRPPSAMSTTTLGFPSTGSQLWNFTTGGRIWGSAALDVNENCMYFGSKDYTLYAVDMTTGIQKYVGCCAAQNILPLAHHNDDTPPFLLPGGNTPSHPRAALARAHLPLPSTALSSTAARTDCTILTPRANSSGSYRPTTGLSRRLPWVKTAWW